MSTTIARPAQPAPADQSAPQAPPPDAMLAQLIFGKCVAMAISVAAKLRIADKLAAGPKSAADLARETDTHAGSLYRVLRALASVGVFAETADGRFRLTPMAEYLRTGVPGSMRGVADYFGSDWSWRPWGQLLHSVRTGETAFDHVFGEPCFDYLAKHPEESAVFNEGMTGFSSKVGPAVAEAYDFSTFGTVVDVGGGHGMLLTTILKAFPKVRGVVFDAPHVVEGAAGPIRVAGLADRCRTEGGDFFQSVPAGGDAYLMKHIIHDWPDDKAATILKNCRQAVNPGGRLLLVEIVIKPENEPDLGKILDLEMLVLPSGRERTEAEYARLFATAGWRLTRVVPTKSPMQVIEGEPI
jgi:SAM-dependent methyltransferase